VVFWVHIVFSFFVELFVIGFAIVEFHQLLSQKNMHGFFHKNYKATCQILIGQNLCAPQPNWFS
jgi:hypothetical protein